MKARVNPRLDAGEVLVNLEAPSRPVGKWQVRLPDPPGHRIAGVQVDGKEVRRDADGRVDLTGRSGKLVVRFGVEKR